MKHFILCLFLGLLIVASDAEAQLSQLPGPFGGKVDGLYQEGNKIYASSPFGLYVSTDDGYHWSPLKITLPSGLRSTKLLFKKNNILLMEMVTGTGVGGLHRSTDEGKTFERIFDSSTYSLAQVGEELWLARKSIGLSSDKRNFIRSSDFGKTWIEQPRPAGGWVYQVASDGKNIFCIAVHNQHIQQVVWRSFDNGVTWDSLHGRPQANNRWSFHEDYQPISLASVITGSDTTLWVGFMPQAKRPMKLPTLYRVINRDSLLEPIPSVIDRYISQIVTTPRFVFVVASGSLLKYDIAADTLLDITYNVYTSYFGTGTILPIQASLEGDALVGFEDGLARFNSQLASYARSDSGLTASPVNCLLSRNDTLYAVTSPYLRKHRLWASPDRGLSWELLDYRLGESLQINDISMVSNGLLIGHDTTIDLFSNGTNTTLANTEIQASQFHRVADTLYCRSYYDWSMSTDEGVTWSYRGRASVSYLNDNCSIVGPGHHIFQCGGYGTVVRSSDGALTWDTISTAPYILTNAGQPAVSGNALFIMGRTKENYWAVLRSDDLGRSWKQIVGQLDYSGVLYPLGGKLMYGTNRGLFICGLHGENPAPVSGFTGYVASIAHDDVNLYVGTTSNSIWKIALATLGIQASVAKSISTATKVMLTPNPATDHITIDESAMVTILNMAGVTLFHSHVTAGERIDITFLPKGPYMMRVGDAAPAMLAVE